MGQEKIEDKLSDRISKASLTRRTVLSGAAAIGLSTMARAQAPAEVKVGLIVPLSGIYTRPGQVMRMGAEMGIEHINAQGGIKSLGGAKMKLVVIDCGDTTEKAKNAAQRMVAQEADLVAATGSYLSSFTLAVTEVTERAELPVLTLSYSDLLTERGFKFIFQTAAPASRQSELGLPELMKLAETASGKRLKTVAMLMDNTATSVATAKALKEQIFAQEGLQLVVEEVWTPPLSDATPLIQKVVISTYGDMWLMKAALEQAGKADRLAVAQAFRTMDGGPSKHYPGGQLKFDEKGRRVGAGVVIVQWQSGVPVTVYPSDLALAAPFWPKKS